MGYMYVNGLGLAVDYGEAAKWYRKAASRGNSHGQYHLGLIYHGGEGLPEDYLKAHMWVNPGAAHGYADAKKQRDDIAKLMTRSQIADDQRLAGEWKPKGRD
jgi:uncharacterized protein